MRLLSEDDLDLKDLTPAELDTAWDLWFDLAQSTNDADPPYTHGVFVGVASAHRQSPATTAHTPGESTGGSAES